MEGSPGYNALPLSSVEVSEAESSDGVPPSVSDGPDESSDEDLEHRNMMLATRVSIIF